MATIKAIEGRSVHQIQSGQVIVDLCSVVKELVENGLDAGATNIEVRFRNQGLDSIEVQDNGSGINPHNYEAIALKHHTSKLSSYSDLASLHTFGFRGEALSSLCALSQFTITTCLASDAPKGTKLEFEISGKLKGTSVVAAQKGTTVTVENLFHNLPVRRRELERNIKREWNRVVTVLGQYACIETGVKLSVTQQPNKGKKTTLFSTRGNQTTRENIINVFGAKTLTALLPLDLKLELEPTSGASQRWSTQDDFGAQKIRISGHISRPAFGEGRQTPDRQMFFVNSRPCGLPQVAKAFNEVYKTFNSHQAPFIFANIEMDTHFYDVNVSPDKRTILLHDQSRMLDKLKISLTELFESQDYTVPMSQLPTPRQPSYKQLTIDREITSTSMATSAASHDCDGEENTSVQGSFSTVEEDSDVEDSEEQQDSLQARTATNLINKWTDEKTDERAEHSIGNISTDLNYDAENLSKDKLKLIEKFKKKRERKGLADQGINDAAENFPESTETPVASYQPPKPVMDFNERIANMQKTSPLESETASKSPLYELEEPIPAFSSPIRRSHSGIVAIGTSRERFRGVPEDVATISIGDQMITSSIRITSQTYQTKGLAATKPKRIGSTALSFGNRLSERFGAATGSDLNVALSVTHGEENYEEGEIQPSEREEEVPISSADTSEEVSDMAGEDDGSQQDLHSEAEIDDSASMVAPGEPDEGSVDEVEKKAQEEAKVENMIKKAEQESTYSSEENSKRANFIVKPVTRRKDATVQQIGWLNTTVTQIDLQARKLSTVLSKHIDSDGESSNTLSEIANAEEKLSLIIHKGDFGKMKIVGQFNLGFILASRSSDQQDIDSQSLSRSDNLFIIDQHASDEKYNFERLQATTIVQSQRLVLPKRLDLTAVEEEIVMENVEALSKNGFIVAIDESGDSPVGQRCQLISLPLSRETTFSLSDLEELISLLSEHPSGSVPRPSRVRKMFAMRACRSSIMIGRTLNSQQMAKVVQHMGELDKPWNCPHGRPTMRHLCNLGIWDQMGWREGDGIEGEKGISTDWGAYVNRARDR